MKCRRTKPPTRPVDPIVAQLREIRLDSGTAQRAVERKFNRSNHHVLSEWERGLRDPSLRNLHSWCYALGLKLTLEPIEQPNE